MIAIVAGTGALPGLIAEALIARGEVPVVCALRGFPPVVPEVCPRIAFRIETIGSLLAELPRLGVTQVVLAGAIRRPQVDVSAIDQLTVPLVPRLMAAIAKGDDGALREVIAMFEGAGLSVVGAHDIVPELLPSKGVLTRAAPDAEVARSIEAARSALAGMARADLGQACVVVGDKVIAGEDDAGTDAMLAALAPVYERVEMTSHPLEWAFDAVTDPIGTAVDWLAGTDSETAPDAPPIDAEGGILFKAPKPGQELRADMPVIGPETAMKAAEAGLAGIVIEAGAVMVIDLPQVLSVLDAQRMFLWVWTP